MALQIAQAATVVIFIVNGVLQFSADQPNKGIVSFLFAMANYLIFYK